MRRVTEKKQFDIFAPLHSTCTTALLYISTKFLSSLDVDVGPSLDSLHRIALIHSRYQSLSKELIRVKESDN